MKAIVYLPLLTSALLLGWYLLTPSAPQIPATPSGSNTLALSHQAEPITLSRTPTPQQPIVEMPASVRGTDIDGQLEVDSQGNLIISRQVRHLFDYFLSLVGEEELSQSIARLRHYLTEHLEDPARQQALALLDSYLDYQQQVATLETRFPVTGTLDDLYAREQAVQQLRASLFSREAHAAFFGSEELYNGFTLERLAIMRDDNLDDQQKAQAIEDLRENLPEEMQQLLVPQLHQELRQKTLALREAGADEQAIRSLRMELLGPDATERLEALDQSRAEWQQRVADFQRERDSIMNQPGLADDDRQAAVNALLEEQFSETERLRLTH